MDKQEIKAEIESLAKSQGFYQRILNSINEQPELLDFLEDQDFKDPIDLILFLEQD